MPLDEKATSPSAGLKNPVVKSPAKEIGGVEAVPPTLKSALLPANHKAITPPLKNCNSLPKLL